MNQKTLPERLKSGAVILGQLWKIPEHRCPAAWSLDICTCQPVKSFCKARLQWLTLAVEAGRDLEEDPYGLALAMTASEWDATGLSMKVQHPEIGEFPMGSAVGCVTRCSELVKLMEVPEVLSSTLRVLKVFPNALVQRIEKPLKEAVPGDAAVLPEVNLEEDFT